MLFLKGNAQLACLPSPERLTIPPKSLSQHSFSFQHKSQINHQTKQFPSPTRATVLKLHLSNFIAGFLSLFVMVLKGTFSTPQLSPSAAHYQGKLIYIYPIAVSLSPIQKQEYKVQRQETRFKKGRGLSLPHPSAVFPSDSKTLRPLTFSPPHCSLTSRPYQWLHA